MRDRLNSLAGWQMCVTEPGAFADPQSLLSAAQDWIAAVVPSTAASCLRNAGRWSLENPAMRFDAVDCWYRVSFMAPATVAGSDVILGLDGLATVAEVWLNGELILSSDNMFLAHECSVGHLLGASNDLHIRFRSLDEFLAKKRPRPRWRAPMIENQQLRWYRTTVLGRTPGWSPPCAAIGPWRDIWLDFRRLPRIGDIRLHAAMRDGDGLVSVSGMVQGIDLSGLSLELSLSGADSEHSISLNLDGDRRFSGELRIPSPKLWWPHTHGDPTRYRATLRLIPSASESIRLPLGDVGFRTIEVDSVNGEFSVRVNGVDVFCRGACWTPLDPVTLHAPDAAYDQTIRQVRDAGLNMLRVGGTMVYESESFYDRCDALGVLVWQDFMFANMDFPVDDPAFTRSVCAEARQILDRLRHRPSLAVLCGNSEVSQQAAMWGAPREQWQPELFHGLLRQLTEECCPHTAYWPSSAHGGAFPHQADSGTTSYYGVGAYLRPLADARHSEVRFASECLAFANVPEPQSLLRMPDGAATRVHSAAWKQRSPRDRGAGWDFDDVRDHYLRVLFHVDPLEVRSADHERYLALSRATSAQVMAATFSEWRRRRSTCNGALVWFLRDLWPGAGWGIIAADGIPKAPYFAMRRALQPLAVSISDEGVNGLRIHVHNEQPEAVEATLSLRCFRNRENPVTEGNRTLIVPARSSLELAATDLLEGFSDLSYAYRFGPSSYDLVAVSLRAANQTLLAEDFHLPLGLSPSQDEIGLAAHAEPAGPGVYDLTIQARKFAHFVSVEVSGYACDDQYFHLAPGTPRTLKLRAADPGRPPLLRGTVLALNAQRPVIIEQRR